MPEKPKILLGVTGSIAAYKAAELARLMLKKGWDVWVVMSACATQYVGPLTFRALTGHPVAHGSFAELEQETYTHLGLSEGAAAMVVAPAMNVRMWENAAVQANVATLKKRGATVIEPGTGELACGDTGAGRLAELADIVRAVEQKIAQG
jgi:phosphopantothenoylcysteine decarboxylase/phosphopantothenate--cysteine ligase